MSIRACRVFLMGSVVLNLILVMKLTLVQSPSCPTCVNPTHLNVKLPRANPILSPQHSSSSSSRSINNSVDYVVFVGGVPRSGTTLTRVMLDSHPDIRCGEETRVLPRIMSMRSKWSKSEKEHQRLLAAGLSDDTLDSATRAFVSHIINAHGEPAKYLCNKDPLLLNYMNDVHRIYPKAKFLLMVRDGRAVAYSIVSRNVTISGVDNKNYMSAALFWNRIVNRMLTDCRKLGRGLCMAVHYEDLVRSPKLWMKNILQFLQIPWHENVLHHHELINKEVSLSKYVCGCGCVWVRVCVHLYVLGLGGIHK